jgi:hypothetical protein
MKLNSQSDEISRICEKLETRSSVKAETQYPKRFSLRQARVPQLSGEPLATAGQGFGKSESKGTASIRQWANKGCFAHSPLMDFPPHQRPNVSRLESFRSEIAAMRASNWPFLKIAAWLDEHHQINVSKEAVRQFCKVRGIGQVSRMAEQPSSRPIQPIPNKNTQKFEFDDSCPIRTKRNC